MRASLLDARPKASRTVEQALAQWGVGRLDAFDKTKALNVEPPVLRVDGFLTAEQCRHIRQLALWQMSHNASMAESKDYLNYRVNKEVTSTGSSEEARALIDDQRLDDATLTASNGAGFRITATDEMLDVVSEKVLRLMGMERRGIRREERIYVKPDRRRIMVRDCTVVRYGLQDGVPPHVDGKDCTVLIYLSDVEEGAGGATVFPENGPLRVLPVEGTALMYESQKDLLHYSESITKGEKWIMQLLIDFRCALSGPIVDYETGQIIDYPDEDASMPPASTAAAA